MEKAKDYQIRLTAVGDPGRMVTSQLFPIKNKIPLALILVPAVVVVAVVGILLSGGGDDPPPEEEIPNPLLPD